VPFDIAPVELSERRFGYEVERRSHFDSCSFTRRFTYVLSLSGQFRYVEIQASVPQFLHFVVNNALGAPACFQGNPQLPSGRPGIARHRGAWQSLRIFRLGKADTTKSLSSRRLEYVSTPIRQPQH
jgi:hypothetical protein